MASKNTVADVEARQLSWSKRAAPGLGLFCDWTDQQVWMQNLSVTGRLVWLVKCKLNLCLISSFTHRWCQAAEMRKGLFCSAVTNSLQLWSVSDSVSTESRREIKEFFFHHFSAEFTWSLCLHSRTSRRESTVVLKTWLNRTRSNRIIIPRLVSTHSPSEPRRRLFTLKQKDCTEISWDRIFLWAGTR